MIAACMLIVMIGIARGAGMEAGSFTLPLTLPQLPNFVVHASSTGTTTIDTTAAIWPCDTTSGNFTITLPSPVTGTVYIIKKITTDTATLTVATTSGNIDGAATRTLITPYASVTVYTDGTNWFIH